MNVGVRAIPAAPEPLRPVRRIPALRLAICFAVVALAAGVLASRLRLLQEEAERTQFVHLVHTLALAVEAEALVLEARGDDAGLRALASASPMKLLNPVPANYRGESEERKPSNPIPGTWRFDVVQRELVYAPRAAPAMLAGSQRPELARFKLVAGRSDDGDARTERERRRESALRLVAIEVPPWLEDSAAAPRSLP